MYVKTTERILLILDYPVRSAYLQLSFARYNVSLYVLDFNSTLIIRFGECTLN